MEEPQVKLDVLMLQILVLVALFHSPLPYVCQTVDAIARTRLTRQIPEAYGRS
jgi:hypothetical protein